MNGQKTALIVVLLVVLWTAGFGQDSRGFAKPEDIDIYKFEPAQSVQSDSRQLMMKANEFYQKGDYENSARYYLAYLQQSPDDASSWYNLSCVYGLLGNAELAAKYLKIAYRKGFTDVGHVERDTDFDSIKQEKYFIQTVDSLRAWNDKKAYYTGEMRYFAASGYLPYWIHFPKNYDKNKPATLMIAMHGYGDKAYSFSPIWRYIEDSNVIFVVPEAPYPFVDGDRAAFSWAPFVSMDDSLWYSAYKKTEHYILDLQKHMASTYKIDQTWLMGFSQGAFNGFILAIENPTVFNGLLACGGGLVTDALQEKAYESARQLKVIISHGKQDRVVSFEEGQKAYDILKSKGLDVTLHEFEGGHSVSPDGMKLFLEKIK
jgi:phospholipase/carboxylesterase